MKNHEKTFAEDGNGKGSKNTRKYVPKWDAEARAECLHPAQHPLQHLTLKLLRTQIRERCLRQTIRRESAEEECDERVLLDGRALKKKKVRVKEGASTLSLTLPFGRKRPGGEFWEPLWHLFSDVFEYRFCIDFSLTFYRF